MIVIEADRDFSEFSDEFLVSMIPVSIETMSYCLKTVMFSRMAGVNYAIAESKEKNITEELKGILDQYGNMPILMLLQRAQSVTTKAGFYLN